MDGALGYSIGGLCLSIVTFIVGYVVGKKVKIKQVDDLINKV